MEERIGTIDNLSIISNNNNNDNNSGILFVGIPAITNAADEEAHQIMFKLDNNINTDGGGSDNGNSGDPFLNILVPYFRLQPGEVLDPKILEQEAQDAIDEGCETGMCPHISPSTLQRAAEEGTLERIKLSSSSSSTTDDVTTTTNTILYLYYDESAHLKQRPINERATAYVVSKSENNNNNDDDIPTTIYGDAFIAKLVRTKVGSNHSDLKPMSLTIEEMKQESWFRE